MDGIEDLGSVLGFFGAFHGDAFQLFESSSLATLFQTCADIFSDLRDEESSCIDVDWKWGGDIVLIAICL
jgi:hypothetical protein